ncbi:MAG TPA: substrate-binding domain-containing protein [Solirubrobacteraceae bacterium]|nr:substrate-binding domain-containing protein [Solirubrobacteraceae bacterium]
MIARLRALIAVAVAASIAVLASGCGGSRAPLPQQPGLPAISADPARAPAGAAAGVDVFGLARHRLRFFVITHGEASGLFWPVVRNGAQAAAAQLGVSVTYEAPDTYNLARMTQLIRSAIAQRPAGLVVSLPNPAGLEPAIAAARRAGIPVISINSGSDAFKKVGTLLHVGENEYRAGFATGRRLVADRGAHHVLCVIHEPHNVGLQQRCHGLAAAVRAAGGESRELAVDVQRPQQAEQLMAAALRPGTFDAMLTLDSAMSGPALQALRADRLLGHVAYATFDLAPRVLRAVRTGQIAFAVDQQGYLQGYLPIVLLAQYHLYGILPDRGKLLSTGPVFITRNNATRVLALVNQGVR